MFLTIQPYEGGMASTSSSYCRCWCHPQFQNLRITRPCGIMSQRVIVGVCPHTLIMMMTSYYPSNQRVLMTPLIMLHLHVNKFNIEICVRGAYPCFIQVFILFNDKFTVRSCVLVFLSIFVVFKVPFNFLKLLFGQFIPV